MNELTKFLVEGILNETTEKAVALFGGGFKPPTKGHLEVVNNGIKQYPEITEVKILVGGGARKSDDIVTQDQAVKIWNLYNDIGFIDKPTTIIPVDSPFDYYKSYLRANPDDKVYVFIGSREGDKGDQFDVKQRSEFVKKYSDNVIPVEVSTTGGVSGTLARKLFKTDIDGFRNMFPENLLDTDFDKILNILNNKSTDNTRKSTLKTTEPLTPLNEEKMSMDDFNLVGAVLRDKNKTEKIHKLLLQMFPQQKELLDYSYKNDSYAEFKRVIFHIDKYKIEGPKLIQHTKLKLDPEIYKERDRKYEEYAEGKIKKYFRDSDSDPRTLDLSKVPPITIDSEGEVADGNHRAFLAIKQQKPLKAYQIVNAKNDHPNVEKILNIVGRKKQEENIDPKSQAKHKGKAAPFGSAYEPLNENATYSSKIDYKQQIKDLTKHMIKKGMNILPLPKVIFKHGDQENASQFLGKTAYYSPSDMTVVLYTEGRHPKDIVRSFAHEMVHHIQNLEDRLENISTTNTMEDDNLNDIEREAYTRGNMVFRNWTDNMDGEEVSSLSEGPQFGVLYHFTEYLLDVLDDNMLRGPVSLTRSKDSFVTEWLGDQPYFILDKDKLRTKYKIRPYKDTSDNPDYEPISYYDEMEEVIDTDVTNLSKYIIKVVLPEPNEEYEDALKEKGIPYEIDKPLNEAIVGEKIECDNCGWSWNIVDGGDDLYMCHKCGHDNEPENGDPFGLKAYARELMEDFNIEDIKPIAKSVEKPKEVRIFTTNCGCDKT